MRVDTHSFFLMRAGGGLGRVGVLRGRVRSSNSASSSSNCRVRQVLVQAVKVCARLVCRSHVEPAVCGGVGLGHDDEFGGEAPLEVGFFEVVDHVFQVLRCSDL